jgi:hypothetical protein
MHRELIIRGFMPSVDDRAARLQRVAALHRTQVDVTKDARQEFAIGMWKGGAISDLRNPAADAPVRRIAELATSGRQGEVFKETICDHELEITQEEAERYLRQTCLYYNDVANLDDIEEIQDIKSGAIEEGSVGARQRHLKRVARGQLMCALTPALWELDRHIDKQHEPVVVVSNQHPNLADAHSDCIRGKKFAPGGLERYTEMVYENAALQFQAVDFFDGKFGFAGRSGAKTVLGGSFFGSPQSLLGRPRYHGKKIGHNGFY